MDLVWHALPSWKVHKHQPVPEFRVISGNWAWWDRRNQTDQQLIKASTISQGSQPFVCSGGGHILTTEENVGAMLLLIDPRAVGESVVNSSVTVQIGQRYAARASYYYAGYDLLNLPNFKKRYWKLELVKDNSIIKTAVLHHTANPMVVTLAAGVDFSDPSEIKFYAWLANAGNAFSYVMPDIRRVDNNCHFGSGNLFLEETLSETFNQQNHFDNGSSIIVFGNASLSPVYCLPEGFRCRGSLSPVSLADRIRSGGCTPYSLRQPAMNFLHPVWRGAGYTYTSGVPAGPVLSVDNGGQEETVEVPYNSQGTYYPSTFFGLYDRYTDTPVYSHCVPGYRNSLSALVPDVDGPPLHHESSARTRLKKIRVTPNFQIRVSVNGTFPAQVTDHDSHDPIDLDLDTGCLGDWYGSTTLGNGMPIYYLVSLRRAETFRDINATISQASLQEATTLEFSYYITHPANVTVSLLRNGPASGVAILGNFSQKITEGQTQLDATQQSSLFQGQALHLGSSLSASSSFTIQAVGT